MASCSNTRWKKTGERQVYLLKQVHQKPIHAMLKILKILGVIVFIGVLSSCQPKMDTSDLEAWIGEINSRPPGRLEPVPDIVTTRPVLDREIIRDPFNLPE